MDRIRQMLDTLSELSNEQLDELEAGVLSEFDVLEKQDDVTREAVTQMEELASAAEALSSERSRRAEEAAALSTARDEAISRLRGGEESVDADEEFVPETEDAEEDNTEEEEDETVTADAGQPSVQPAEVSANPEVGKPDSEITEQFSGEPQQTHVTAEQLNQNPAANEEVTVEESVDATGDDSEEDNSETETTSEEETVTASVQEPGAAVVPDDRRPVSVSKAPVTITAGADIQGITAGSELPNMRSVADAMFRRMHAMGRTSGGDGEQHTIATLTASFPEDRSLHTNGTPSENWDKVSKVVAPEAITAAGGLCAPVEVSYDIFGLEGSTARPVRDALAVFSADRGGIRFVTPPVLADLNGSTSVWTLQDDIDAATPGAPDPVKPCLRVNCGNEVVVYTDAIPLCLTFGNLGARAWPELVERHLELAMIWHARFSEQRLLTRIGSLSTAVTAARKLGAARDYFVQLEQAAAGYRNRYRMDPATSLRVILPAWFKNMLRADLVMQLPGDGQDETFNLADNFMNTWFTARHINVTWTLDGEAGQILGAQAAGALNPFPSTVVWYLFAEGTFLFLDGGTLDLGLVRDSTLNGTNDYKVFLETFEGVAKVGVESLRVTSTLQVNGSSAGTVNTVV